MNKKAIWWTVAIIIVIAVVAIVVIKSSFSQSQNNTGQPSQEISDQINQAYGDQDYNSLETSDNDFAALDESVEQLE